MLAFGPSSLLALALPVADRVANGAWHPRLVAAGTLYALGVTAAGDVPLNEALRQTEPSGAAWRAFSGPWALWNGVRTMAGVAPIALVAGRV